VTITQNTISIAPSIIEGFSANGQFPVWFQSPKQADNYPPAKRAAKRASDTAGRQAASTGECLGDKTG
jgi:hypothetical protein